MQRKKNMRPIIKTSMARPRKTISAKPLPRIRGPEDFAAAFAVSRETVDKLALYEELLIKWQRAVNLVSPLTLKDIWHRHFADSAQIVALAPQARNWIDLGSGGGFPGLVIAILLANHENYCVHLIESNGRKCAFLSEVARRTGAPVRIHEGRIEEISRGGLIGPADAVTSRALAPLGSILGLSCGFLVENTCGLFLKGRDAQQEIEEAGETWRFDHRLIPSRTSADGWIVEVRNLASQGDDRR